jgi:hypothetical protein
LDPKTFGSLNPAVAREDSSPSVNHDRPEEPEGLDALLKQVDLPLAVNPRISRIDLKICNGEHE